jgi:hypothetical protein
VLLHVAAYLHCRVGFSQQQLLLVRLLHTTRLLLTAPLPYYSAHACYQQLQGLALQGLLL